MLFPTLGFLVFFTGVVLGLLALRRDFAAQKVFLVAASYVFYAQWNWRYCLLLAGVTLVAWIGGLAVGATTAPRARQWLVGLTVTALLGLLGFFKYYEFLAENVNAAAVALDAPAPLPFLEVILPVGISFFTFHGISYVVDVHRRDVAVCRRLSDMLLYLAFFPQLVAGPIVRASQFLPQLAAPRATDHALAPAVVLIVGGLFKKVVIAGHLAEQLTDPVFFDPTAHGSADLLLATYGYAVQIYCDFSAYSDMAIGLAALCGFRFPVNFDQPYRARTLSEFWRRWHISLSSWLRDYLYKPLGGDRHGRARTWGNLAITMLLGGIWHGAAWKFVIWGALHGAGLIVERALGLRDMARRPWAVQVLSALVVFHFVCLAWIFFRAESLDTALEYLAGLLALRPGAERSTPFALALVALGLALHVLPRDLSRRAALRLEGWPRWALAAGAGTAIAAIDALGPDGVPAFIYFQF